MFPNNIIRLALWSDDAAEAEFAGGFNYSFATNPSATEYQTWRADNFTESDLLDARISGDGADPDFDGLVNLLEFALGGEPKTANPQIQPTSAVSDFSGTDSLEFSYLRRTPASGLLYVPETSSDLKTWNDDPAQFTPLGTTPVGAGFETVRLRVSTPVGTEPSFIRLKFTLSQ